MRFKIAVKFKKEVKDIQGETIVKFVNIPEIKQIYTGRYYEIEAENAQSVKKIAQELLTNPITEEFEFL